MPRDLVPTREGPKKEISTEVPKHNRPYTMPRGGDMSPKGTPEELHKRDFERAKAHIANLTSASAVELLQTLGVGLLEMYLLAEEVGQKREMILRAFPKPGNRARQRYLPDSIAQRQGANELPVAVDA